MIILEMLKVILLGVVEGITEWLPISSTGHMLLVDEFIQINAADDFKEFFFVVIQLGAIMAVVLLYWKKMLPYMWWGNKRPHWRKPVINLWIKVVIACIPGTIVTLLFDDFVDEHLHTPVVIGLTLVIYGILFIVIELWNKGRRPAVEKIWQLSYVDALIIGLFQVLSIVPGTSRSGSTIIGALLIGVARPVAAEFTFWMAVPVMFGYSLLKLVRFGRLLTIAEFGITILGCLVSFVVSVVVIRFFMNYIRRHDFKVFGYYRIGLGIIVLLYFLIRG